MRDQIEKKVPYCPAPNATTKIMPVVFRKIGALLWAIVLLALVCLAFWVTWPPVTPKDWLTIISTVSLLASYVYRQWAWLNLHVQKIRLWLLNSTAHWSLDIRHELADEDQTERELSARLESALIEHYPDVIRIDRRESLDFHFQIHRQLSARLLFCSSSDGAVVHVQVLDLSFGYRDCLRRVKEHICPLLEFIEKELRVAANCSKYSLQAAFQCNNPYFGVFLQEVRESQILAFQLVLASTTPGVRMTVSKDSISLVTDSLNLFRTNIEHVFCLTTGME